MEDMNIKYSAASPENLHGLHYLRKQKIPKAIMTKTQKKPFKERLRKKVARRKSRKTRESSEDDPVIDNLSNMISSTSGLESMTEGYRKFVDNCKVGKGHAKIVRLLNEDKTTQFAFQKRLSRMDWRKLHCVDVDKIVREVDLDALETVVETITFSDVQTEDTRNFTEANFIKIFRLAQLMIEYLLHVQESLATHKSQLLAKGTSIQRRIEKHREKFGNLSSSMTQARHDLKQVKKTLRIYEAMLKVQGENQKQQILQQQKQQSMAQQMDLHLSRRHPKANEISEEKFLAAVSKAEEAAVARVKAETTDALQNEIQHLRALSQVELQRQKLRRNFNLQASLRESNGKVQDMQNKLEQVQLQMGNNLSLASKKNVVTVQRKVKDEKVEEKLKDLENQLQMVHKEMKELTQEKIILMKDLLSTKSKVCLLRSQKSQRRNYPSSKDEETDMIIEKEQRKNFKDELIVDPKSLLLTNENYKNQIIEDDNSSIESQKVVKEKNTQNHLNANSYKEDRSKLVDQNLHSNRKQQLLSSNGNMTIYKSRETRRQSDSTPPSTKREKMLHLDLEDNNVQDIAKIDLKMDLASAKGKRANKHKEKNVGISRRTSREKKFLLQEEDVVDEQVNKEKLAKEALENETRRLQEITITASLDVGEEGPTLPIAEKEKWLQERPYHPIPQRPHILSRYPHSPTLFDCKRDELVHRLDEQLGGELMKFGFSRDMKGISDSVHQAATTALEKQNKHRSSVLLTNQKRSLEYERGAIVWHTQRAVRERDIQIIESRFEEESEPSSSRDSDQDQPLSSDDDHVQNYTWNGVSRKTRNEDQDGATNISKYESGTKKFSDRKNMNYSANSFSRKQMNEFRMQTQIEQMQNSPLHGEQCNVYNTKHQTPTFSPLWQKKKSKVESGNIYEENGIEGEYGLGDWESDEEQSIVRVIRSKNNRGENKDQNSLGKAPTVDISSDDSQTFKELNAEIDEIIRL